jgi:uncharacterized protein YegP (UPF0339 family)
MAAKYEHKRTSDEQFMFNLKAANGEIILASERYTAESSAQVGNGERHRVHEDQWAQRTV